MSKTLGVLGGMGPAATVAFLARVQALTPVILAGEDRAGFMACVYGVKRGDVGVENRAAMARLGQALATSGAEAVIAGCTEVPLLIAQVDVPVSLVDSAEVLATVCVRTCLN